jgi:signal transduction histidine kinase
LLSSLVASIASGEPFAHAEGMLAVALGRPDAPPRGLFILPAEAPSFDPGLALVATCGGLALEAISQRNELAAQLRVHANLFGTVAHDLRNPLNAFVMSTDLLRDDLEHNRMDAARALSLTSRMSRASGRMQTLIEELVEADGLIMHPIRPALEAVSAASVACLAVSEATSRDREKRTSIGCDALDDDVPVLADKLRLAHAIAKVLAFTSRATSEGGSVLLGVTREGSRVVFRTRALGASGAPVATPEEHRGGLALLIARRLIEAQGGILAVDAGPAFALTTSLPTCT